MKVKLLRDARINHKAGEIVEVSPAEFEFLTSLGSAVGVSAAPTIEKAVMAPEETAAKKTVKKKR